MVLSRHDSVGELPSMLSNLIFPLRALKSDSLMLVTPLSSIFMKKFKEFNIRVEYVIIQILEFSDIVSLSLRNVLYF